MSRVPRIRFKGFEEDWEQRKLGEVCSIITKQTGFDYSSTIKPALLNEKADNTYPFIQNKDFNGTTINMDTDFFIPISIAEKFPNIVLDRPSLLISISGRIGNAGFYSCVHKAFIGGAVGICKLKYDDDGKFIIHELESEYGQKYFRLLIKASSHANITVEDIRNMELIFPNKKEEKVCISTFFSTLGHLITLHQRKLEKLKIIKKSMLENLFPQNGEKTPKIRFSGFTKDWEQRKVIDIAETRRGLTYKPTDICDDGIRVLRSSNINEDKFVKREDDIFVDRKAINIPFVQNGDILITSANGSSRLVGKHAIIREITDSSAVHGGFMLLATAKNPQFLNAAMGASWYIKFINLFVAGGNGAIGNLNKNDLDEQTILVPYEIEQVIIGRFFENLDHLITLHQSKLEKLQKIKKSLLESMFV